jgi:hypothetical protein
MCLSLTPFWSCKLNLHLALKLGSMPVSLERYGVYMMSKLLVTVISLFICISLSSALSAKNSNAQENEEIINTSKKAVLSVYSYDFKNYDKQLAKAKPYFSKEGWNEFITALQISSNIDGVKSKKLVVSASLRGEIILTEHIADNIGWDWSLLANLNSPIYSYSSWRLYVPITVTLKNQKGKLIKTIKYDVEVLFVKSITNPEANGVLQLITLPTELTNCNKLSDGEYRRIIANHTYQEPAINILGKKYLPITSVHDDGSFNGRLVAQDAKNVIFTHVTGSWNINNGKLIETIKNDSENILQPGLVNTDKIVCMSDKGFRAIDTKDGLYTALQINN